MPFEKIWSFNWKQFLSSRKHPNLTVSSQVAEYLHSITYRDDDTMALTENFVIKPEATTPAIDWSQVPLLLRNYDKRT